jgi:hypothetical protein
VENGTFKSREVMGTIYDSPSWGEAVGRIEGDGLVYDGVGLFAKCIGRIDSKGQVYDGVGISSRCVGRFDSDGKVYDGVGMFASYVGRVDSDGKVYGTGVFGTCVGRAESPHIFGGGAALLLLIR